MRCPAWSEPEMGNFTGNSAWSGHDCISLANKPEAHSPCIPCPAGISHALPCTNYVTSNAKESMGWKLYGWTVDTLDRPPMWSYLLLYLLKQFCFCSWIVKCINEKIFAERLCQPFSKCSKPLSEQNFQIARIIKLKFDVSIYTSAWTEQTGHLRITSSHRFFDQMCFTFEL